MDRDATSFMPSSLTLVASQQPPNVLKESDALSVGSEIDAPNSCPIPNYRFTLMPVTIKMIRDGLAGDLTDGLLINNTIISTVRLVGRFLDQEITENKASFVLCDGTGTMSGRIWFGGDDALLAQFCCIGNGGYGTFVGRVALRAVPVELNSYSCRKISDFNEMTMHFLHVIKTHVDFTRGPQGRRNDPSPGGRLAGATSSATSCALSDDSGKALVVSPQPLPLAMAPGGKIATGCSTLVYPFSDVGSLPPTIGSPISRAVVDAILRLSKSAGPVGSHIDEISAALLTTSDAIRPFLLDLMSVGEVYMTVDDDHFKET